MARPAQQMETERDDEVETIAAISLQAFTRHQNQRSR